jgi:hypothetical protein
MHVGIVVVVQEATPHFRIVPFKVRLDFVVVSLRQDALVILVTVACTPKVLLLLMVVHLFYLEIFI